MQHPVVIFLMGPTAAGKTQLAVQMVLRQLPVDIVSVDSTLVYRGMNIGTAKPDAEVMKVAPHKLVDIIDPVTTYSAGQFYSDALREIANIHAIGKIPLLVGGTMLYFRVLERGLAKLPPAEPIVRTRLTKELKQYGVQGLYNRLSQVDPIAATRIHPHDWQRIQRALEIQELLGCSITTFWKHQEKQLLPFRIIKFIIAPASRQLLNDIITQRFLLMLNMGFIEEVIQLRARGDLDLNTPSMRAVGYRQVWSYLDGHHNFTTMVEQGIRATRQLAKRQFVWLRAESDAEWLPNNTHPDSLVNKIIYRLHLEGIHLIGT